jgi:hypothetical protein
MNAGDDPGTSEPLRRRLEALAAQARDRSARMTAELGRRRGLPPEPGDVFVLPATAELPVEWVVLEQRSSASGKLLVVPADTNPLAGTADVEVAAEALGGPLTLRCGFAARLDARLFDPELRSGVVGPEIVALALQRCREVESGELEASPLAEEVDVVPDYLDWLREVPERSRTLAVAAEREEPKTAYTPWWGGARLLAAALAAVAIGLSIWVFQLRREVDLLSAPVFNPSPVDIVLGGNVRGRKVIPVPREASHVLLYLVINPSPEPQDGYLEIIRGAGKLVWRSPRVHLSSAGELKLVVPRKLLPDGNYRFLVYQESGSSAVVDESVWFETAE